jgi:CubicO group peptidase (beta-lactamase class C family)
VAWLAAAAAQPVDRIDEFVRAEQARQQVPGVAVAVIQKGDVVSARGYGLANLEHGVP